MKAVNIKWDVDHEEDLSFLPKEIDLPAGMKDEDEISDYLSDVTGYCHKGFSLAEREHASLDSMIESATTRNTESVFGSKEIERDSTLR